MLPAHVAEQALDEMHLGARHTYLRQDGGRVPCGANVRERPGSVAPIGGVVEQTARSLL